MSLDSPLVSVCIPCYNSAKYVAETIKCLLDQTYHNLEIIAVDDGSRDETLNTLKAITDKRFRCFTQSNNGAASARNVAYKSSTGEFIKFLDSDDLINKDCIAAQVKAISNKTNCVASARWGRFFKEDIANFTFTPETVWKTLPGIDWVINSLIDHGSNMTQPGIFLIPRRLIEQEGLWDESLSLIDDFDFMTRILTACKEVIFCEEAILYYRSGLKNCLSAQVSEKHFESALKSQFSGINTILSRRNTIESRQACANSLQLWAFKFYPQHMDMYNEVEKKINELGGSSIKMRGGKLFMLLSKKLGWKKTKKLKKFLYRYLNPEKKDL